MEECFTCLFRTRVVCATMKCVLMKVCAVLTSAVVCNFFSAFARCIGEDVVYAHLPSSVPHININLLSL